MTRIAATPLFFLLALYSFIGQAQTKTQQWECAVNLQQGDTGTMSLSKKGDQVDGALTTVRNGNNFKSDLNGRWTGNTINLSRLLDANSSEPMAGIVVTMGTEKVKIGGRFSSEFQGVWSADCNLVSSSAVTQGSGASDTRSEATNIIVPSITSRVTPGKPSSKDRVKLSARAAHPDGIETLTFFVGNKKVHTCNSDACEFNYGRLKSGQYNWYVQATSKSGTTNEKRISQFVVSSALASTCTIRGLATGPSANLSLSYQVNLVGKGDQAGYRKTTNFKELEYTFTGVPRGEYTVEVNTQADTSVLWSPRSPTLTCGSQADLRQNFDFR